MLYNLYGNFLHDMSSSLQYKTQLKRQLNRWSLRCSWSIACRRCSNYIFILHLTLAFNILQKDNIYPRRETFQFGDLVRLILDILRYINRDNCYYYTMLSQAQSSYSMLNHINALWHPCTLFRVLRCFRFLWNTQWTIYIYILYIYITTYAMCVLMTNDFK